MASNQTVDFKHLGLDFISIQIQLIQISTTLIWLIYCMLEMLLRFFCCLTFSYFLDVLPISFLPEAMYLYFAPTIQIMFDADCPDAVCLFLFCASSVWVARKPPGFAFIDFDDRRDAQDAIRDIDGM